MDDMDRQCVEVFTLAVIQMVKEGRYRTTSRTEELTDQQLEERTEQETLEEFVARNVTQYPQLLDTMTQDEFWAVVLGSQFDSPLQRKTILRAKYGFDGVDLLSAGLAERTVRRYAGRLLRGACVPLTREQAYWTAGVEHVVGVDEAGSGAVCGPLLAAAVELPRELDPAILDEVRDCKLIASHNTRRRLDALIRQHAVRVALGAASAAETDTLKDEARALAMGRALRRLGTYDIALIDGAPIASLEEERHIFIPQGERASLSIACAAQVAQVCRDSIMARLDERHPGYGLARNTGHSTPEHMAALVRLGPTRHHYPNNHAVRRALRARSESCSEVAAR